MLTKCIKLGINLVILLMIVSCSSEQEKAATDEKLFNALENHLSILQKNQYLQQELMRSCNLYYDANNKWPDSYETLLNWLDSTKTSSSLKKSDFKNIQFTPKGVNMEIEFLVIDHQHGHIVFFHGAEAPSSMPVQSQQKK